MSEKVEVLKESKVIHRDSMSTQMFVVRCLSLYKPEYPERCLVYLLNNLEMLTPELKRKASENDAIIYDILHEYEF